MSRHLILLETHLPPPLQSALNRLVEEANAAGRSMFVTGATMRDVIAGLQAHELELVVEGDPAKLCAAAPSDLPVHLAAAAIEQYPKTGGRPRMVPATIHDYLRSRDFSVNAIALSVTRASRGLLLDPTNGAADIAARELRALTSQTFHAKPVRMLELLRLKVRLGFAVYSRTQAQFDDALEAGVWRRIKTAELREELQRVWAEPRALEVLQAWDQSGMLAELIPSISGGSLNTAGFTKMQKYRQMVPFGVAFPVDDRALFFNVLTDNMSPKDRTAFLVSAGLEPDAEWMKLGRRVTKLEKDLTAATVQRPAHICDVLGKAGPTLTLLLALRSTQRVVQDRIRNYLTKYLPESQQSRAATAAAHRP